MFSLEEAGPGTGLAIPKPMGQIHSMKIEDRYEPPRWVILSMGLLFFMVVSGLAFAFYSSRGFILLANPLTPDLDDSQILEAEEDPLPDIDQPLANPGYLGPMACVACHAKRVADFLKTNHAHAMRAPEPALMPSGFHPGQNRVATTEPDFHFEMLRSGDEFFQKSWAHESEGKWKNESKKIDFVYGWGRLDEVNFSWDQDRLWELPVAWIYPMDAWGVSSTFQPESAGATAREATPNCLECHTTWFSHYPGTSNRYKPESFILGVTCERCHGPGKEHVAFHESHPLEKKPYGVVNPGKLTRERQIEVCTQCHSNATRENGPVFSYRPGEPLDAHIRTIHPKNPEDDHVANQVTYLRQSKCFQKSETLTCATCHDPHKPHQPYQKGEGTVSCTGCHRSDDCRERGKLPEEIRENCVGCHMPPRVWMNVNFNIGGDRFVPPIRRYEHRIGIYPEATNAVLLQFHETATPAKKGKEIQTLREAIVKYWKNEARARREKHRILGALGAIREALAVDGKNQELRTLLLTYSQEQTSLILDCANADKKRNQGELQTSRSLLEKVLQLKPDFAMAHGKLGTLFASLGKKDQAKNELISVARFDPDESYGYALLGWLAYLNNHPGEAIDYFRMASEIEPNVAKNHYHWGLACLQLQKWDEALDQFDKAVQIDPHHSGARQGLSHALIKKGRKREALVQARLAARITALSSADILLTLVDAYLENGDQKRARAMARKGLKLVQKANQGDLENLFRDRLNSLAQPNP